jgi:hypothetical protein
MATLIEKPSRRNELALYCAARAAESAGLTMLALGWIKPAHVCALLCCLFVIRCFYMLCCALPDTVSCGDHTKRQLACLEGG